VRSNPPHRNLERQRFFGIYSPANGLRRGRVENRVGIMCFERKRLLQDEQAAWGEFRNVRDSKWSSDVEIVRSHDIALATSRRLRDHLAACQECKEGEGIRKAKGASEACR
jgi:hypothetical protein